LKTHDFVGNKNIFTIHMKQVKKDDAEQDKNIKETWPKIAFKLNGGYDAISNWFSKAFFVILLSIVKKFVILLSMLKYLLFTWNKSSKLLLLELWVILRIISPSCSFLFAKLSYQNNL